jgi:hypothetical protein
MGVLFSGASVGGPAGVANAVGALKGMLAQNLFEIDQLTLGATHIQSLAGGAAHGYTCRVVASVLEAPEPLDDDRDYLLWTDVTDNAAHATILCEKVRERM